MYVRTGVDQIQVVRIDRCRHRELLKYGVADCLIWPNICLMTAAHKKADGCPSCCRLHHISGSVPALNMPADSKQNLSRSEENFTAAIAVIGTHLSDLPKAG